MSEEKRAAPHIGVHIIKADDEPGRPIQKAEKPTALDTQEARNAGEFVTPPYPLVGLKSLVDNSNILPQCIGSYKNNIAGFGIGLRYKEEGDEETAEMRAEWDRAQEIIDHTMLSA